MTPSDLDPNHEPAAWSPDTDCFDADPDPVPNRVYSFLGLLIVAALVVAAVMEVMR